MNYRVYIGSLSKTIFANVRELEYDCLLDKYEDDFTECDYFDLLHNLRIDSLLELDLIFKDKISLIYEQGIPLFEKRETQEWFGDTKPYVLKREGFENIIKNFSMFNKYQILCLQQLFEFDWSNNVLILYKL